jgi:hypothetical protein
MSQASLFLLAMGMLVAAAPATAAAPAADPLRPSYVQPVQSAGRHRGQRYALQAVFGDQQRRVAVLNGQVVQPGDLVQGARVQRIGAAHIELRAGNRRWIVRLPDASMLESGEKR